MREFKPFALYAGVALRGFGLRWQDKHIAVGVVELHLAATHKLHAKHAIYMVAENLSQIQHRSTLLGRKMFANAVLPFGRVAVCRLQTIARALNQRALQGGGGCEVLLEEVRVDENLGVARVKYHLGRNGVTHHNIEIEMSCVVKRYGPLGSWACLLNLLGLREGLGPFISLFPCSVTTDAHHC